MASPAAMSQGIHDGIGVTRGAGIAAGAPPRLACVAAEARTRARSSAGGAASGAR